LGSGAKVLASGAEFVVSRTAIGVHSGCMV
jgi:hypothetical protein